MHENLSFLVSSLVTTYKTPVHVRVSVVNEAQSQMACLDLCLCACLRWTAESARPSVSRHSSDDIAGRPTVRVTA